MGMWMRRTREERREEATIGLTPAERARLRARGKRDCPTCETGTTPVAHLRPFAVRRNGELRAGYACPCQIERLA